MRKIIALCLVLLACSVTAASFTVYTDPKVIAVQLELAQPKKLMIAGDSLAQGYDGKIRGWGPGIKTELTRLTDAAGINLQYTTRAAVTCQEALTNIVSWLTTDQPDAVWLNCGTNNAAGAPPGMTNFENTYISIVNAILAFKPTIQVYITELIYANTGWSKNQVDVNVAVIHASWWATDPSRVKIVDWSRIPRCGYIKQPNGDGTHPSTAGYAFGATEIFRVMAPWFGVPQPTDYLPSAVRPFYDTGLTCTA